MMIIIFILQYKCGNIIFTILCLCYVIQEESESNRQLCDFSSILNVKVPLVKLSLMLVFGCFPMGPNNPMWCLE